MLPSPGGTDIKQVGERAHLPPWLRWGGADIGRECHVWEINGVTEASREARHADSHAMNIYSLALICVCGRPGIASPLLVLTHICSCVCQSEYVCWFKQQAGYIIFEVLGALRTSIAFRFFSIWVRNKIITLDIFVHTDFIAFYYYFRMCLTYLIINKYCFPNLTSHI